MTTINDIVNNLERREVFIGTVNADKADLPVIDTRGLIELAVYAYVGARTTSGDSNTIAIQLAHGDTTTVGEMNDVTTSDIVVGPEEDAAVANGTFYLANDTNGDNKIVGVNYVGTKRYLHVNIDVTGTPGDTDIAVFVLGVPQVLPATT